MCVFALAGTNLEQEKWTGPICVIKRVPKQAIFVSTTGTKLQLFIERASPIISDDTTTRGVPLFDPIAKL